jgi:serine/threonine-protein kinase
VEIGELVRDFRVEARVGGAGAVREYLGRGPDGTEVLLRVLEAGSAPGAEATLRFLRECEIHRKLEHPNLQRALGYGIHGGEQYLVLERQQGVPLSRWLAAREGGCPPATALAIADEVLLALEHAHSRGVIHRDVRPANVLLPLADGPIKLVNFSVARAEDHLLETGRGAILGTFRYASPEQNRGQPVGPTSDLYSLGLVLYEMLTGQVVIRADDLVDALAAQAAPLVPPSRLVAAVPKLLDLVVSKLLAAEPAQRYASATAARAALAAARTRAA